MFYFDTLKTSLLIKLLKVLVSLHSSFCSLYLSIPDISVIMFLTFSFNVCLLVRHQFLYTYEIRDNITVFYILVFKIFRLETTHKLHWTPCYSHSPNLMCSKVLLECNLTLRKSFYVYSICLRKWLKTKYAVVINPFW